MARFRVQIFKRIDINGKEWSNSYHIEATDLASSVFIAGDIANAEQSVHKSNVQFIRMRISSALEGDNLFTTIVLNDVGAISVTSGQLPLWNVARVDFEVFGGRPSYKYLRLPLDENETQNGFLTSPVLTVLNDLYVVPLQALFPETPGATGLVDEDGNSFTGATINPLIQMRQLRRRRRPAGGGGLGTPQ